MKSITTVLLFLFLVSCEEGNVYKYQATNNSSNLEFNAARLFPNEELQLRLNGDLILKTTIKDSLKGFRLSRKFCLPYTQNFVLSIKTFRSGKAYIDTTIVGYKDTLGYHLNISMPYPLNWKDYYKEGLPAPVKKWGYLPIDSCIRFISLVSDSVYKNTFSCGLSNE